MTQPNKPQTKGRWSMQLISLAVVVLGFFFMRKRDEETGDETDDPELEDIDADLDALVDLEEPLSTDVVADEVAVELEEREL